MQRHLPTAVSPRVSRTAGCRFPAVLIAAALLAPWPVAPASAQITSNPRVVEFDPSADHTLVLSNGQPAVARYDLEISLAGAASPFHTVNLAKPSPQTDGKIRHDFSGQVSGWPLPGGTYEARVSAVGPNGTGRSDVSNRFTFDPPCSWTLSRTSLSVGASGGAQNVTVTAGTGCTWTASTSTTWITMTVTSGSGNGTAAFTVAANTAGTSRSGSVTIAGQTVSVTQAGVTCTYTLSPTSKNSVAAGGAGSVSVTAPTGCTWTAVSNGAWVTVTAGASGSGNGSVSFSATANPGVLTRTTTLTIGGKTFTVTQDGAIIAPSAPRNLRLTGGAS